MKVNLMTNQRVTSSAEVRSIPDIPLSIRLAFLALLKTSKGQLTIELPDQRRFTFDQGITGPSGEITISDPSMVKRVLSAGDIGFAEAYMDGQFSTPDLTSVLQFFAVNFETAGKLGRGSPLRNLLSKLVDQVTRRNTKKGSKQNILAHYDLGNAFYEKWLDPSMTYSSAIFVDTDDMGPAQKLKYDSIAKKIGARPDDHILEIGSGWGGFAEHAAMHYGSKITTITISDEQHAYASKRIFEAGLAERVKVELRDYRDVDGKFDGVASIEMFEAVGETYWPTYFNKISSVLDHGKRAALQIITIDDSLFESYRKRVDFIQKYIFPGGMLPSEEALNKEFRQAGLQFQEQTMFGDSYAKTLRRWADDFRAQWPQIEQLGFDRTFRNLWEYYLCYCEAGFLTGRTNVGQFVVSKA